MRHFQFSLRWLFGATAFVAVACTALLNATELWQSLFVSAMLATLVLSILLVVYSRQSVRAFWVGFCVCGWAYYLLVSYYLDEKGVHIADPFKGKPSQLVSTRLLELAYQRAIPLVRTSGDPFMQPIPPPDGSNDSDEHRRMGLMANYPNFSCFVNIGHCLWTLLFAGVGGRIARFLYDRQT